MAEFMPPTEELGEPREYRGTFEYYKSGLIFREWRWRYVASNGREVYRSSEGYKNKADMLKSIPRCSEVEGAFRREV